MQYIVFEDHFGSPTSLLFRDSGIWKKVPEEGVLLTDPRSATVFDSRPEARAAIKRTMNWHRVMKHSTRAEFVIVRLAAAQPPMPTKKPGKKGGEG